MNILVYETDIRIKKDYLDYLKKEGHTLIEEQTQDYNTQEIHAIIVYATIVDKKLIDNFPHLTHIMRCGVGLDKVDTIYAKEKKISVLNTPLANQSSVADLALRGTLSLLRQPILGYQQLKENKVGIRFSFEGEELSQMSIGFLGFGNIAKKIQNRLIGFGAKQYHVYDPYINTVREKNTTLCQTHKELIEQSDIIYIVMPLTPTTKDTLNKEFFDKCGTNKMIINIARGGLTNEKDLYDYLSTHPNSYYYADVRQQEPSIPESTQKLLSLPNYLLTPHIGAHTKQAQERMHQFNLLAHK